MTDWRAETLVDELVPEELDWRHWVSRHPIAALSVAAVAGYLLGRSRGEELVEAATSRVADTFSENVHHLIDSRG